MAESPQVSLRMVCPGRLRWYGTGKAIEIEHFVARLRRLGGPPDRDDAMISKKQAAVADLAPHRIHGRQDIGILDHHGPRHVCSSSGARCPARCDLLMQDWFQFGASRFRASPAMVPR
jgi:hypothetical protein